MCEVRRAPTTAALVAAIHVLLPFAAMKTWMAGTSPAMTNERVALEPPRLCRRYREALPCETGSLHSAVVETDIPARLDRLPWSRFHTLVVIALGITWIFDGLE